MKWSLFEVPHSPTSLLLPGDEESSAWEVSCLAFLSCSPLSLSLSRPQSQSARTIHNVQESAVNVIACT